MRKPTYPITKFILPMKPTYMNGTELCYDSIEVFTVYGMDEWEVKEMFRTPQTLYGMKVVTSRTIGEVVTEIVPRTWKERLFTLPWRPFQKHKQHTYCKANGTFIKDDHFNVIYCHPDDYAKLLQSLK